MQRPLTGVRVVSLEQYMSAPYCTLLLADAGAEVIKIERPGSGDPRRAIPPFVEGKQGAKKAGGFMAYNRNKKSLALNLRDETGQQVYRRLVSKSDVVVENLRPGAMAKLGLDYQALREINSRLIYAAISGFGRLEGYQGPYSQRPSFDIVAEAMSGIMHLVGFDDKPPSWTIYGLSDLCSGLFTAFGIMQALYMRERTGQGQEVDVAMLDAMLSLNERMVALYSLTGEAPMRGRLKHLYPRGAFECQDGYIALNVPDDLTWRRFCEALGRTELVHDERYTTGPARAQNADTLRPVIEDLLAGLTRDEVVEILNARSVPVGPVFSAADIFADPHVAARHMLVEVEDPTAGTYTFARTPTYLSAAPEIPTRPAPDLGQHTREILQQLLGYSAAEVEPLLANGVVGVPNEA
jgi:CoA:oxalate CoA-transferase